MYNVLLVIHILIVFSLIGVILIQRSEGGVLGIGGGGGLMSGRAAGNLMTRATAILVAGFFLCSLALAILGNHRGTPGSIMEQAVPASPVMPGTPVAPTSGGIGLAPAAPAQPSSAPTAPAAPLSH